MVMVWMKLELMVPDSRHAVVGMSGRLVSFDAKQLTEDALELVPEALRAQKVDDEVGRVVEIDEEHAEAERVPVLEELPVGAQFAEQLERGVRQREHDEGDGDGEQHDGDLLLFRLLHVVVVVRLDGHSVVETLARRDLAVKVVTGDKVVHARAQVVLGLTRLRFALGVELLAEEEIAPRGAIAGVAPRPAH